MKKSAVFASVSVTLFIAMVAVFVRPTEKPQISTLAEVTASIASDRPANIAAAYGRLPIHFEPNVGQADEAVDFIARGRGYSLFLHDGNATLSLTNDAKKKAAAISIAPVGGDPAGVAGADPFAVRRQDPSRHLQAVVKTASGVEQSRRVQTCDSRLEPPKP